MTPRHMYTNTHTHTHTYTHTHKERDLTYLYLSIYSQKCCLCICPCVRPSVCLSSPSINQQSIDVSIYLSIYLSICTGTRYTNTRCVVYNHTTLNIRADKMVDLCISWFLYVFVCSLQSKFTLKVSSARRHVRPRHGSCAAEARLATRSRLPRIPSNLRTKKGSLFGIE